MALFGRCNVFLSAILATALAAGVAEAATCGNNASGYEAWKQEFGREAAARGFSERALDALQDTSYARKTIAADRNQKSFKLSLDQFMRKRGGQTITKRGKALKQRNASLFASLEARYGVPPGPLIAIWGMETVFGTYMGDQHTLSAVATLAYDCRRSDYFTEQLNAALTLIELGTLNPKAIGAAHGEIGQTQFLPVNVLLYGVDGDGDGRIDMVGSIADALASTANFLRGHGWRPGAGYQPGEPNFNAIRGWNSASVYQQAIAIIAAEIDAH